MSEKEIITKLKELEIMKKVMIDKSNFEQAAMIREDERKLRSQLEELIKEREESQQGNF